MNKIVRKENFSEKVILFEVEAPLIAKSRRAGHFVLVKVGATGERIPLTIADADTQKGTITLVVQKMGVSSTKFCNLNVGDEITDLVGPLGKATHIENFGTVVPNNKIPRRFEVGAPSPTDLMYKILTDAYAAQGFTPGSNQDGALLNSERVWQDKGAPQFGSGAGAN